MFRKLVSFVVVAMLAGCVDSDTASNVLSANGFKDIVITGYDAFGCSDEDSFRTAFQATSPSGQRVTGVVCSGYMKGSTIRFK